MIKNILLVHGGFVDGSGWQGVYKILSAEGFNVRIVQNPTLSLADDVAVTKRAIAAADGPVILVGHSYGGAVVSEAGTDPKVKGVVYIAAFAPDQGESVSSLIANPAPGAPVPPILPPQDGFLFLDRTKFAASFAADVEPALMPQVAALLIDTFGWRLAYVGLAVAVLVVAFPPVALFLRDPPGFARVQRLREPADTGAAVPGVAAGEALRSWLFWGLATAFFLDVIAINGTLTHIVPLLTDRGVPRQIATAALSGTGFALIFGRVLSGWCLDRFWGPYVAIVFFVLPMTGIAILISGTGGFAPFLGAIACGLGIGAEIDLMAFFTSRYFGLRDYARLYGTMFGIFALGVGIGPALSGASFDRFHSYTPAFALFVILLAIGCLVFLRLGPYPFPALGEAVFGAAEKMPA